MTTPVPKSGSTRSSVIILTVRFATGTVIDLPMYCL